MSPSNSSEKKIPISKSSGKPDKMGEPQPKWRIVDLTEKTGSRKFQPTSEGRSGSARVRSTNTGYKRKKSFPVKPVVMGIINLVLIFGVGIGAYFGWGYYKNNFANKDSQVKVVSQDDEYHDRDLQERVDEIKNIMGEDKDSEATSTGFSSGSEIAKKFMLKIKDNNIDYLNIRNDSTTNSEVIGRALPGEEYEFIRENDGWYNILRTEGNGWVHGNYVQVISESNTETETEIDDDSSSAGATVSRVKVASSVGYVNVRDAASTSGKLLGRVNTGEEYEFTKTEGRWYFINVSFDGAVGGWVHGDYLKEM